MKCNECVGLGLFRFNKQTASARKYAAHFNHEELNGSEFLSDSSVSYTHLTLPTKA